MKEADIGADQILDGVEHRRVVHDLVDPAEQEVRLEIMPFAELPSFLALEPLQLVKIMPRLIRTERLHRKHEPVALVPRDLFLAQLLAQSSCLLPWPER